MRERLEALRLERTPAGHDGEHFRLSPNAIDRIVEALTAPPVVVPEPQA